MLFLDILDWYQDVWMYFFLEMLNESEIVQRFDKLAQIIYSQLVMFFEA